jgi:U2-associated protein SR140
MNREDAEEAMETCNETDPFNVGRHLMMRWGKNVKKTGEALKLTPMPKAAAESSMRNTNMQATLIQDPDEIFLEPAAQLSVDGLPLMIRFDSKPQPIDVFNAVAYNPEAHGANSIPVELPPDPNQDTMIRQRADDKVRDDAIRKEQEERRYPIREKEYMTGRQLERARGGRRKGDRKGMSEGRAVMMDRELQEFDLLVRKKLTVSRDAICAAMAFCFENSASAREIADLLKTCLVDEASVDTKIARLYLLSDILFNSQQPGVKNAFMYRDAIEKMAGEVFASLGKTDARDGSIGRMTMNKLRMAMKSVLGAWTEWSVYNPSFLDELEARFDGREIKDESSKKEMEVKETTEEKDEKPAEPVEIIIKTSQGDWTEVNESDKKTNEKPNELQRLEIARSDNNLLSDKGEQAKNTTEENTNLDGQLVSRLQYDGENNEGQEITALVGAPMDKEDLDGKPVAENNADLKDLDGSPIEDPADVQDIDGEAIADDDVDGSPLEDEDVDGESLDGNQLSEAFDVGKEELDGEIVDSQDLDGEAIDEEAMEGEKLDGTAIDGEDLDGEEVDTSDLR